MPTAVDAELMSPLEVRRPCPFFSEDNDNSGKVRLTIFDEACPLIALASRFRFVALPSRSSENSMHEGRERPPVSGQMIFSIQGSDPSVHGWC